jgi:hypothetical protein
MQHYHSPAGAAGPNPDTNQQSKPAAWRMLSYWFLPEATLNAALPQYSR